LAGENAAGDPLLSGGPEQSASDNESPQLVADVPAAPVPES
jgi:hypothetical protein